MVAGYLSKRFGSSIVTAVCNFSLSLSLSGCVVYVRVGTCRLLSDSKNGGGHLRRRWHLRGHCIALLLRMCLCRMWYRRDTYAYREFGNPTFVVHSGGGERRRSDVTANGDVGEEADVRAGCGFVDLWICLWVCVIGLSLIVHRPSYRQRMSMIGANISN